MDTMHKMTKDYTLEEYPRKGTHTYVYDRGNGRRTVYVHYVDGLEVWEYNPNLWRGWKLMSRVIGEVEVW